MMQLKELNLNVIMPLIDMCCGDMILPPVWWNALHLNRPLRTLLPGNVPKPHERSV